MTLAEREFMRWRKLCWMSLMRGLHEKDWEVIVKSNRTRLQLLCDVAQIDFDDYVRKCWEIKKQQDLIEEQKRIEQKDEV